MSAAVWVAESQSLSWLGATVVTYNLCLVLCCTVTACYVCCAAVCLLRRALVVSVVCVAATLSSATSTPRLSRSSTRSAPLTSRQTAWDRWVATLLSLVAWESLGAQGHGRQQGSGLGCGCDIAQTPILFASRTLVGHSWQTGQNLTQRFMCACVAGAHLVTVVSVLCGVLLCCRLP